MTNTIKGIEAEWLWLWVICERHADDTQRPSGPWVPVSSTLANTRLEAIASYNATYKTISRSYKSDRRAGWALATRCQLIPRYPGREEV